jgi:hypothetical protein
VALARTHTGWENEHLATYLLSRLAFVAAPITVADDVGTDLFCTLYDTVEGKRGPVLVPLNSIAVQIKSSRQAIDVSAKLGYLARLEVPYFVGVVSQSTLTMDIFSGRFLPNMLSLRGEDSRVHLDLVDRLDGQWRTGNDEIGFRVMCPLVTGLSAADRREDLPAKLELLRADAAVALKGISSRLNMEFIFDVPTGLEIFTGPASAQVFHSNFVKRVAEALHNLAWLVERGNAVPGALLDMYMAVYEQLAQLGGLDRYVVEAHERLVAARSRRD